jgi:hypothetical protein
LRIKCNYGDGGLGFVSANLICLTYNINGVVNFYIDTGASITTINQRDGMRIGVLPLPSPPLLPPESFPSIEKSIIPIRTANGIIYPYILPKCQIVFNLIGTMLLEYIGDIHVLGIEQQWNSISVLGLDVLKKFNIEFTKEHLFLVR